MGFGNFQIVITLAVASLAPGQTTLPDFGDLSLDQLANIKITSFTNKEQKLSRVAGAVYVITREQIARSGLTSVPELLRLAPGVDVARVNGNQWSVSVRGPVGAYANKLLVLIDGRSVYSPLFSGVYWELGMPLLDDIERIEIVRGPGATIWGANAVLGVINIITRNSRDMHGTTVTAGGGSSERGFGSIATGGAIGSTSYRGYFGGSNNAPLSKRSGARANDGMSSMQAGFRLDGSHKNDTWMFEGGLFRGVENNTATDVSLATVSLFESPSRFNAYAGNLTGEWRRRVGETGELRIKSYYDYADRPQPQFPEVESRTWDTQFQYDFAAGHIHSLSIGGGERLISEKISPHADLTFSRAALTYLNANAFAQDEMHFAHDTLLVTVGAKLERNHFGGRGTEPSANLLWMPRKNHSIWISAARSLRTPSLFEIAAEGPYFVSPASSSTGGLPVVINYVASPAFSSESVKDFGAGYRGQISKKLSADLSVFYDKYCDLNSTVFTDPVFALTPVPRLDVPDVLRNDGAATGKGAEGSIGLQVLKYWKLEGSYTYNIVSAYVSPSAPPGSQVWGKEPSRNKWRLQSYLNLSKAWELDTFLYWTSAASPTNNYGPEIVVPPYTRLDVRLGYKAGNRWQLSLAGQNLLQTRHLEALAELLSTNSYVKRSVYLKSTWQF